MTTTKAKRILTANKRKMSKPKPALGSYSGELSEVERRDLIRQKPQVNANTIQNQLIVNNHILKEIRDEIKGLRQDLLKQQTTKRQLNPPNTDETKQYLEQYVKAIRDMLPSIMPNKVPGTQGTNPDPGELKKHLADYVKEMTKPEVLEHMPNNLKGAYMRLIQNIIKPNDPIFNEEEDEQQKADPREPVTEDPK